MYYIYCYIDPRTDQVVYVGQTTNLQRRHKSHIGKNGLLRSLAEELAQINIKLNYTLLTIANDQAAANELEKHYIQKFEPLLNITHNHTVVQQRRAEEAYAEQIDYCMRVYDLPYEKAVIFNQWFGHLEGLQLYQRYKNAILITHKKVMGDQDYQKLSPTEILEIALEASGYYDAFRKNESLESEEEDGQP